MSPSSPISVVRNADPVSPEQRAAILASPGFGRSFTDHMVRADYADGAWSAAQLLPYAPLTLDPATMALHYGQLIFEGLKAYRQPDGSVATFRPDQNAARFAKSARRLGMAEVPADLFLDALQALVEIDQDWVPGAGEHRATKERGAEPVDSAAGEHRATKERGTEPVDGAAGEHRATKERGAEPVESTGGDASLYLRPFEMATEVGLGVRAANAYSFFVIASPAGPYFPNGVKPVSVWLSTEYTRAANGGTGEAKCAGNYAATVAPQAQAAAEGCDQVVWLDAAEHRYVEEMGGMNLFFVYGTGPSARIVTPALTGSLLAGVTRDSLLVMAKDLGYIAEEGRISTDEWQAGNASGEITEVFACGTAAVITPVGTVKSATASWTVGDGEPGPVATQLRASLLDLQTGTAPDPHGWVHTLVDAG